MSDILNVTPLIEKQKLLDSYIGQHSSYSHSDLSTMSKMKLAMIVELGEFSNATRCFKIWSKKGSEPREVVLEEFIDIIHFLLSLTYSTYKINDISFEIESKVDEDLTDLILSTYQSMINLDLVLIDKNQIYLVRMKLLKIASKLNFSSKDINSAYDNKNKINYKRQDNNY